MIYVFIEGVKELGKEIQHFFRKLCCEAYYIESHGVSECRITQVKCDYLFCPKTKGASDADR